MSKCSFSIFFFVYIRFATGGTLERRNMLCVLPQLSCVGRETGYHELCGELIIRGWEVCNDVNEVRLETDSPEKFLVFNPWSRQVCVSESKTNNTP